jgi:hypothetical protein
MHFSHVVEKLSRVSLLLTRSIVTLEPAIIYLINLMDLWRNPIKRPTDQVWIYAILPGRMYVLDCSWALTFASHTKSVPAGYTKSNWLTRRRNSSSARHMHIWLSARQQQLAGVAFKRKACRSTKLHHTAVLTWFFSVYLLDCWVITWDCLERIQDFSIV